MHHARPYPASGCRTRRLAARPRKSLRGNLRAYRGRTCGRGQAEFDTPAPHAVQCARRFPIARFFGCLTPMVASEPNTIKHPRRRSRPTRACRLRQREAEPHRRRTAKSAPDGEVARIVAAGRDVVGLRAEPAITRRLHHRTPAIVDVRAVAARGAAGPPGGPFHRCMKPSVRVCMKLTSASSSSSESPSRPTNLVFILSVDSGTGQHVVPSPGSLGPQRRRTSRVL